ncbi:MAG TPA: hypothetical protein HA360_00605 [Nanoarchaeota archaeon]|nr:hypothetical protein [Candidatus Woesearchaeota archaeon]HIH15385.1 hypothetical protein [Nanoarchaeota archaeon]HIH58372.1 hypothetical protein [Nanoarchaeota archaeon]HII13553.1 hypothetical protein [Nanoarchaeota archaeon]HIJ05623.1 hypothetical protein [Nanoarchaeota archaeon]
MKKVHTRIKRRMASPTHLGSARPETRERKKRPKTFTSEESAKKWAEAQGIKKFELRNIRIGTKDKKIRVITLP